MPEKVHFFSLRQAEPSQAPPDIVLRSVKPGRNSDLVDFLLTILDPAVVEGLIKDYQLGVTSKKDVIFFQLDLGGVVAFPDIDGYDEWQRKLADFPQPAVTISPELRIPEGRGIPLRG